MNKPLDELRSQKLAAQIKSQANARFDNAYRAAIATQGALYVQGFLVVSGHGSGPVEHSWLEIDDRVVDPTFPHFNTPATEFYYFPAQQVTVKQLKAIIEESQEDYPEDDPLPIYGDPPYEYYGEVMLGGKDYLSAYEAATAKAIELNRAYQGEN